MMMDFLEEDLYAADILPSKYDPADMEQLAQAQIHLSAEQRNHLEKIFKEHTILFDGQLKKYTGGQVYLNIDPAPTPHCVRAYPVAERIKLIFSWIILCNRMC